MLQLRLCCVDGVQNILFTLSKARFLNSQNSPCATLFSLLCILSFSALFFFLSCALTFPLLPSFFAFSLLSASHPSLSLHECFTHPLLLRRLACCSLSAFQTCTACFCCLLREIGSLTAFVVICSLVEYHCHHSLKKKALLPLPMSHRRHHAKRPLYPVWTSWPVPPRRVWLAVSALLGDACFFVKEEGGVCDKTCGSRGCRSSSLSVSSSQRQRLHKNTKEEKT